jgi:hypothetical protein
MVTDFDQHNIINKPNNNGPLSHTAEKKQEKSENYARTLN